MWSHLSCQHYSNFSAENKLATQRKEFCWTRGFGRHESLEVIHKQAHNALQWSIYRIGSSPLYQMKKQMHSGLVVAFLAIFLCCFVLQRSGADEDQTFWSLEFVISWNRSTGSREEGEINLDQHHRSHHYNHDHQRHYNHHRHHHHHHHRSRWAGRERESLSWQTKAFPTNLSDNLKSK